MVNRMNLDLHSLRMPSMLGQPGLATINITNKGGDLP